MELFIKKKPMLMGVIPFILLGVLYLNASNARLTINPNDKVLPSPAVMVESFVTMATVPDARTGAYLLWSDTRVSLGRLLVGMTLSASIALVLGVSMGVFPRVQQILLPSFTFFSIMPPIAILPIIFIIIGIGETSKILLIVIGTVSVLTRDIYQACIKIPQEHITKAFTLGANRFQVLYHVLVPQILPYLFEAIRLGLGAAWIFLMVGEAIVASEGLGYRIFLVRRFLAMDIIIPYVIWLTLIGFLVDSLLKLFIAKMYPWYVSKLRI
jgi:NitT/TauT family transport system permease protein